MTLRKETSPMEQNISVSKRKRLVKMDGAVPAGSTTQDVERFLDLLSGLFRHVSTRSELQEMVVFDDYYFCR